MENEMAATPRITKNSAEQLRLEERVQLGFASNEKSRDEIHPGLLEHARSCSSVWALKGKSPDSKVLKAQLRKTVDLLASIRRDSAKGEGTKGLPISLHRTLLTSRLLLQATALDVQDSFRWKAPLPQVSSGSDERFPRCYVAARAYLAATNLDFEEDSFRAYMRTAQESGAFQMSEIWLLSPMLQLELLSQLGDTVQQARERMEDGLEQKIDKILAVLHRVREASWKTTFKVLLSLIHI